MRLGAQAPRLAVGLTRVSTAEQGNSGLGLEAQQASIRSFVDAQGWTLVAEYSDIASGKDDRRPGFQSALARCRQLVAVLVAVRLDRITRRAHTLSQLLEDGVSIRAADMPGADDLMLRIPSAFGRRIAALFMPVGPEYIPGIIGIVPMPRRAEASGSCRSCSPHRRCIPAGWHRG